MLQMIGTAPISITSCVFSDHKGIDTSLITDTTGNYFFMKSEYTQQSLITFGFFSDTSINNNFMWSSRTSTLTPKKAFSVKPSLEISSCDFTDNWFSLSQSRSFSKSIKRTAGIFSSIGGALGENYPYLFLILKMKNLNFLRVYSFDGRALVNTGVFTNATVSNIKFTSCNIIQNKNTLFTDTGYYISMDSDSSVGIATFNHLYSNIRFVDSYGGAARISHNLYDKTKSTDEFVSARPMVNFSDIYIIGAYSPENPLFYFNQVSVFGMSNIYVEKSSLIKNGVIYVDSSSHMGQYVLNTTIRNITISNVATQGVGCVYFTSSSYFTLTEVKCIGVTTFFFIAETPGATSALAGCFYFEKGSYNVLSDSTCERSTITQNTTSNKYLTTDKTACFSISRESYSTLQRLSCLELNNNGIGKTDTKFYLGMVSSSDNTAILSSNFTKNVMAGGIYFESSVNVALSYNRFVSNTASALATCLHIVEQSSVIMVNNTLESNLCNCDSNIIIKDQAKFTVSNSYFTSNTANNGAVISTTMGTLLLYTSTFSKNIGLSAASAVLVKLGTTTMTSNIFIDNYGQQNCIWISESIVVFTYNSFFSNRAASRSSNLYIAEVDSITLENCKFRNTIGKTNNIADTLVRGDFIYAYESGVYIRSCSFENSVGSTAGAVYFTSRTRTLSKFLLGAAVYIWVKSQVLRI
jgi:hypothetical protein